MSLHEELTTYTFTNWHIYAIVHALIETGRVTKLECMAETCQRETRIFAKSGHRGQGDLMVIDHIHQRGEGGSHRLENLRLLHLSCNMKKIYTPERSAKISETLRGKRYGGASFQTMSDAAKRGWETRRAKGNS